MEKDGFQRIVSDVSKNLEGVLSRVNLIDGYVDRVIYKKYQNLQRRRWMTQNASEGETWPALNQVYIAAKIKRFAKFPGGGSKMMIATSRLFNSVVGTDLADHKKIVNNHTLEIFTSVPYAPEANNARDFTKFSPETMASIKSDIIKYISGGGK